MATSTSKAKRRRKALTAVEMAQARKLCRERLLSDLHEQEASTGTPLPGERALSENYGIPLSVVRATLGELKSEGIITSVPRGGVRLAAKPELPKSLAGIKVAFVGYMEVTNPDSRQTRPAVVCAGLERILNEQGGTLQFFNIWGVEDFRRIVEDIRQKQIEAILYNGSDHTSSEQELQALSELGLPMVAIEKQTSLCDSVAFDNVRIGRIAAEHVLELGHRDVCVLEFPEYEWSDTRVRSIREEFRRRGQPEPDAMAFGYLPDQAEVREFVRSRAAAYSACVAVNDELAALLLAEARAEGIPVPEDLSIIGADDRLDKRHLNLTTVQRSDLELGLAAYEILKQTLLKPETRRKPTLHLLECPLIVRETTAPCQPKERNEG